MPGYVIHLAVGKQYLKRKNSIKDSERFFNGIVMPDMLDKATSHYGEDTANPNLIKYIEANNMDDDFSKGYFLHLLTDYLFYNRYMENFEWSPEVYDDYDRLNKLLIERYDVKVPDELKSIVQFKDGDLEVFDFESICKFIETVGHLDLDSVIKSKEFDKEYEHQKGEKAYEEFLDYNKILKVKFDFSGVDPKYKFECNTEDQRLKSIIENNLKSICTFERTLDEDIYKLSINDQIFINVSKSTGKIESINTLTAFETRLLAQGKLNKVPFSRENVSDFLPRTDLHTHFAGALTPNSLIEVGKKHDIGYPASKLVDIGIDISKYEIEEDGTIKLKIINEFDIEKLKNALIISPITQETFNKMEEIYALRKPFTKNKQMFPDLLRELAKDYEAAGIEYAELSLSAFLKDPDYMQMLEDNLPQIKKETGVKLRFLAAMSRHSDKEYNLDDTDRLLKIARSPYIVGCDFMGHETNQTLEFAEELKIIARYAIEEDPNFAIRVHAGENPIFKSNMYDALKTIYDEHTAVQQEKGKEMPMPQVRIGHGLYGLEINEDGNFKKVEPGAVLKLAKEMGVIIEFNMSSNLALNNINGVEEVPIKRYIEEGINVVLGTDGHGLYSTCSAQEVLLAKAAGLSIEDFEKIKETESEILRKAKEREQSHPKIEDVKALYDNITYSTEDGKSRFNDEVEQRYIKEKQDKKENLIKKISKINAVTSSAEIEQDTDGKVPVMVSGASKSSWDNVASKDKEDIRILMQVLADTLNPKEAYVVTGGTNFGVERAMHEAVYRKNLETEERLVLLGTFTMEATKDIEEGVVQNTITHATILENANNWMQLPDTQLEYVREKKGHMIAVAGGAIVSDMIQRAHNIGVKMHLMNGPYGASTDKSYSLRGNDYSFDTTKELLERLYSSNPEIFNTNFSIEQIDEYIEQARDKIERHERDENSSNFGLSSFEKIYMAVGQKDIEDADRKLNQELDNKSVQKDEVDGEVGM